MRRARQRREKNMGSTARARWVWLGYGKGDPHWVRVPRVMRPTLLGAMRPRHGRKTKRSRPGSPGGRPIVGLLGCMAERLQCELLEKSVVDVVVVTPVNPHPNPSPQYHQPSLKTWTRTLHPAPLTPLALHPQTPLKPKQTPTHSS